MSAPGRWHCLTHLQHQVSDLQKARDRSPIPQGTSEHRTGEIVDHGPVPTNVGSYEPFGAEGSAGHMDSVDPMPFLTAGLILSAVLGAVAGFIAARRGWRLTRQGA
nr:hypothetical protein GCM10017611_76320 [Rhodococcus wratislaviensis]